MLGEGGGVGVWDGVVSIYWDDAVLYGFLVCQGKLSHL